MTVVTRAEWGAAPAAPAEPLYGANVEGLVIHWPAMSEPIRGIASVSAALRSWQRMHMAPPRNYRDIAYCVAVDQDGNRYILRGLDGQSGANGDEDVNRRFGAVLVVLAPGEQPSEAMLAELRRVVADHRELFRRSTKILGHTDVRPEPTACPGPIMLAKIRAGALEPVAAPRDALRADLNAAMAATKDALSKVARRPRLRFNLERARKSLSKARRINRGE